MYNNILSISALELFEQFSKVDYLKCNKHYTIPAMIYIIHTFKNAAKRSLTGKTTSIFQKKTKKNPAIGGIENFKCFIRDKLKLV